ncbi:HIT family protein [Variovorax boronicumulans]|uniref:Diadenosine tetraphosphate (Ap4A) HIT family hydrolase n=1 Tax=Variovorax boronicumulans TaxID=436515 RepID=A0AAW8DYI1_9BURK|nr:HIT family protein [Variovorax boronicumulans]MDP9878808.1 diadenosine tetraphosphate (Ap4A) HIT family hydrolase [Variovorax boronicumulans]MDP9916245.1 diadenosine tetraphosphate (Ap4A) HIT family hydrolase [Variovorax boronicumulans]MDP9924092.1 diadenosine tetraphosphate (Ap4A) HIT family hydrolase [Variovorax boronicumulans]GER12696.1 HIT family protein [Variovorax boronicumulans]
MTAVAGCPLCDAPGGRVVFEGAKLRVIHAQEEGFPAFYRVVWRDHAAEFSDLDAADRVLCMEAVVRVEQCLRDALAPTKLNIAALGNMVAHLHWHVIARFDWDSHFPGSVWAAVQRTAPAERLAAVQALLPQAEADMVRRLATLA